MIVSLSRIVNVMEVNHGRTPFDVIPVKPFVVVLDINGYEYPMKGSFASEKDALAACASHYMGPCVAIVNRNCDFTEGRGPMTFHKLFRSLRAAEEYIAKQDGIYGSKQYRQIYFGLNIAGEGYAILNWNGYEIKLVQFED